MVPTLYISSCKHISVSDGYHNKLSKILIKTNQIFNCKKHLQCSLNIAKMRRSCAPSMKVAVEIKQEQLPRRSLTVSTVGEADPTVVELFKSTENHARVLENIAKARKTQPTKDPEKDLSGKVVDILKVRFNVVWGKITTKKHKTWEGDGTLELCGKSATLRNEEGKVIASTNVVKVDEIEEGSRLIVGSKEVEVIERATEESKLEKENSEQNVPAKRIKLDNSETCKFKSPAHCQISVEPSTSRKPVTQPTFKQVGMSKEVIPNGYVPLVMKAPTVEHQWRHNKDKFPICEVTVPYCLGKHLRPHQRDGLHFLYECITGLRMVDSDTFGAILADEMGLGKTLQVISLIYTLLKQGPYGKPLLKRVLIVTPSSLVENWDKEICKWIKTERIFTFIVGPNNKLKKYVQSTHIPILIISYEMLAKQITELESIKFDLVICDEGHRLKNSSIKVSSVLDGIDCPRRIILTGTPIQNDLQEFHSLINFVNPGLLGTYSEFKSQYENPIVQSQQPNVLPQSKELGQSRLNELNAITSAFVLRRTQEVINKYLPAKQELVVFAYPSELQQQLLKTALKFYVQSGVTAISPLQLITLLKKVCNHPSLITSTDKNDPESLMALLNNNLPAWHKMCPSDSGKLGILEALLENLVECREKIVIVSYYSKTLDMIMGLCQHYNYKYCRLDGSTPSHDRSKIVATFNNPASDIFIFLLSAKAGGTGLNLVGASRLVLFDNDWNPASDLQAMSRIWRDGQVRKVYIYRLITAFSIEEKIYQRQISKTSLSGTVVDQKQNLSNLKFSNEELKDLFSYTNEVEDCLTHQMLACDCKGIGDIPEPLSNSSQETAEAESPERSKFQIRHAKGRPKKDKHSLKMQELMRWEHHRAPVKNDVLEELSLQACSEEIAFLFRNTVSHSTECFIMGSSNE